jgi:hypothetical protein
MGLRTATVLFLILATGCRPDRSGEARQVIPQLTMDGVQFQVDRGGVTTTTGTAEQLTFRRDTTDVSAVTLSMDLAGETGPIRITAPAGAGQLRLRHFRVSGGIRASRAGDVATTASASIDPGPDGRMGITGEEPVVVVGPGYRLTGTGFDIDPGSGALTLRGRPHLDSGLEATP